MQHQLSLALLFALTAAACSPKDSGDDTTGETTSDTGDDTSHVTTGDEPAVETHVVIHDCGLAPTCEPITIVAAATP